jgi:hypothetical protein
MWWLLGAAVVGGVAYLATRSSRYPTWFQVAMSFGPGTGSDAERTALAAKLRAAVALLAEEPEDFDAAHAIASLDYRSTLRTWTVVLKVPSRVAAGHSAEQASGLMQRMMTGVLPQTSVLAAYTATSASTSLLAGLGR